MSKFIEISKLEIRSEQRKKERHVYVVDYDKTIINTGSIVKVECRPNMQFKIEKEYKFLNVAAVHLNDGGCIFTLETYEEVKNLLSAEATDNSKNDLQIRLELEEKLLGRCMSEVEGE
jgi:hypothetical protein